MNILNRYIAKYILLTEEQQKVLIAMIQCCEKNKFNRKYHYNLTIKYRYYDKFCNYGKFYLKTRRLKKYDTYKDDSRYSAYISPSFFDGCISLKSLDKCYIVVSKNLRFIDFIYLNNDDNKEQTVVIHFDRESKYVELKNHFLFYCIDVILDNKKDAYDYNKYWYTV